MHDALWYWTHFRYAGLGFILLWNGGPTMTAIMGGLVAAKVINFSVILAVATLVDLAGDSFWYWIARGLGSRRVRNWVDRRLRRSAQKVSRYERRFRTYGGKVLLLGKFTEVIDVAFLVAAGMTQMPWRTFYFYDTLASLLKSLTFGTVGYFAWEAWTRVDGWPLHLGIIALAVTIYFGLLKLARRRIVKE